MKNKKAKPQPAVRAAAAPAPLPEKKIRAWLGIIVAAFALILYAQTINYGFVLDDEASVSENRLVHQGIKAIPTLLTTDSWNGADVGEIGRAHV